MSDLEKQLQFLKDHRDMFNITAVSGIVALGTDSDDERAPGFQEPPLAGEWLKSLDHSEDEKPILLKFISYFNWVVADGKVQVNDTEMVDLLVTILEIREFNDGIMLFTAEGWVHCDEKLLIKIINALSKVLLNGRAYPLSKSESVIKALTKSQDVHEALFSEDYVQLKNGVFNVNTGNIQVHHTSIIPSIRLQVDLNGQQPLEANMPKEFGKFINSVTEGDDEYTHYLIDVIAYVIAPFKISSLKSVIFHGDGGNGKTAITELVSSLYEPSSVTNISLDDLHGQFGLSGIQKASLNISQEISASQPKPKAVKQLKAILEENTASLRVNQKYKDPKDYNINLKMLFGSNSVIDFGKVNRKPLSRRMLVLPFNHTPAQPDLKLKEKLQDEKEHILAFLLKKMYEIKQRDELKEQPAVVVEEMDIWFHMKSAYFTKKPKTEKAVRNWLQGKIVSQQGAKEVFQSALNKQIRAEVSDEATAQLCNQIIQNVYDTTILKSNGDRYWKDLAYLHPDVEAVDLNSEQWDMIDFIDFNE